MRLWKGATFSKTKQSRQNVPGEGWVLRESIKSIGKSFPPVLGGPPRKRRSLHGRPVRNGCVNSHMVANTEGKSAYVGPKNAKRQPARRVRRTQLIVRPMFAGGIVPSSVMSAPGEKSGGLAGRFSRRLTGEFPPRKRGGSGGENQVVWKARSGPRD